MTQSNHPIDESSWDYELLVIGAGSGGVRASRKAAALGIKVAVVEYSDLGGTCVNLGCVPKKLFVYASEYPEMAEQAQGFGVDLQCDGVDWPMLRENKNIEIARLNVIYKSLLDNAGVDLIQGKATLVGPHEVKVEDTVYRAKQILLAVGGEPSRPDIPGVEYTWTSDDVFHLKALPKRLMVIGSGYIAVEFAGIMNGLGVNTWLAYRADKVLRGFDEDIRSFVSSEIDKKGVRLLPLHPIESVTKLPSGTLKVTFTGKEAVEVDAVLMCTGRKARVAELGLDNVGIQLNDQGLIDVDTKYQTQCDSVFALGDIIPGPALTPVAIAEAMSFVQQQYQGSTKALDYQNIATAVFCQPQLATVGLTQQQAERQYDSVKVFTTDFKAMKHSLSGINERTFMKMIVDETTDKVLGVHMVGEHAGEIMQGVAIALKASATKAQFDETIGIHPTSAEEFTTLS